MKPNKTIRSLTSIILGFLIGFSAMELIIFAIEGDYTMVGGYLVALIVGLIGVFITVMKDREEVKWELREKKGGVKR